MTLPRLSIVDLMALVFLVALDLGLGQLVGFSLYFAGDRSDLCQFGVLPTSNVLIVAWYLLIRRRGEGRPASVDQVNFLRFGVVAWLGFVAAAMLVSRPTHWLCGALCEGLRITPGLRFVAVVVVQLIAVQIGAGMVGVWWGRTLQGLRENASLGRLPGEPAPERP